MTRTLLQFTLQGRLFGVWKDDVASVVPANSLHQLPLSPSCVAGMSLVEDKGTTIIDTGVCIGLGQRHAPVKSSFLLVGEAAKRMGFQVEGSVDTESYEDAGIVPLPGTVRTAILQSCAIRGESIVPVIEIKELYDRISRGEID